MNKQWIVPMKPTCMGHDPVTLIGLIPFLIIYWCPTAVVIWDSLFHGMKDKTVWVMIVWGLLATITIMACLLRVIRGMAWTRNARGKGDKPKMVLLVDRSGSTSPEMLNEVEKKAIDLSRNYKVHIIEHDTEVLGEYAFDGKFMSPSGGGGGTDILEAYDMAMKQDPSIIGVFTDGYLCSLPKRPECPVLWFMLPYNNPDFKPSWGTIIKNEDWK